ncbi:hypothetical protein [Blastococcus brunescens]|uniref:DUF4126 domain-containing protein n=1 Tax=Blastococcus brunescens TaxID=1564165 RepID=A0ABZ1AVM5_9ACTN|nr:hypothetical protein [Blastococcus sp. BMG 8361]WRL61986.1 hypothetical protein U6N30_18060 [Blastococcus sp. BMG 8361]
MTRSLSRGLVAGAAGTTALNLVGYLDMALRGRPASDVPERVVDALAAGTGRRVPGRGTARQSRRSALGALAGMVNGLGVGVLASGVRSYGVRFPAPVGAVVTGAAAMAATDVPVALLGISDPRGWTASDWLADAAPHLAYGAAVQTVLETMPTDRERATPRRPAGAGVVLRSALLGVAAGSRSALGFAGPVLTASTSAVVRDRDTTRRRVLAGKAFAAAGLTAELVADKHPDAPPRDAAGPLTARVLYGAEGGARLAARERANGALPAVVGMAGAVLGSLAGLRWRRWAAGRVPALQAALVEDGVALGLAALACLPGRNRPHLVAVPPAR